jgi:hypothetical protein
LFLGRVRWGLAIIIFFICQGCPGTTILLISASQVAGITGVSYPYPAIFPSLDCRSVEMSFGKRRKKLEK